MEVHLTTLTELFSIPTELCNKYSIPKFLNEHHQNN